MSRGLEGDEPVTATALVLTLLLNGQPFPTQPAPFLKDGTVMVGFRDLAQGLGATVTHDEATNSVTARKGATVVQLSIGAREAFVNARLVELPTASALVDGRLAVPLRFIAEALGASIDYDKDANIVNVTPSAEPAPVPTKLRAILDAPSEFAGRTVIVSGEYRGWRPSSFAPATSAGPPVTRSDWVLQDETGEIYCTPLKSLDTPFPLFPTENMGRRIVVQGRVAMARSAQPYLRVEGIHAMKGLDGLACMLEPNKETYGPGETVYLRLTIKNPFDKEIQVPIGDDGIQFVVERAGQEIKRWPPRGPGLSSNSPQIKLAPRQKCIVEGEWDQTGVDGVVVPAGMYQVRALVGPRLRSYPHTVRLER